MKSLHPAIRALLRKHSDGLTTKQLARSIGKSELATMNAIKRMPDAFVDRWEGPKRGQYARVWCVVVPPPDCPHPIKDKEAQ